MREGLIPEQEGRGKWAIYFLGKKKSPFILFRGAVEVERLQHSTEVRHTSEDSEGGPVPASAGQEPHCVHLCTSTVSSHL